MSRDLQQHNGSDVVGSALLRVILVDPADGSARVAYSDHLASRGASRMAAAVRPGFDPYHKHICHEYPATACPCRRQVGPNRKCNRIAASSCGTHTLVSGGFGHAVVTPLASFIANAQFSFAQQPLVRVLFLNCNPPQLGADLFAFERLMPRPSSDPSWTDRMNFEARPDTSLIPAVMFDLLTGDAPDARSAYRHYRRERTAILDLSRAAVTWGRATVGLPPLPASYTYDMDGVIPDE